MAEVNQILPLPLPIEGGGTGADTAAGALANLGIVLSTFKSLSGGDQTTTSATAVNITDLVFPVVASSKYLVRGVIHFGTTGLLGSKFALAIPAGATMYVTALSRIATSDTARWVPLVTSGVLQSTAFNTVASPNAAAYFEGTVTVAGTAGNIQFMGASVNAGDTTTFSSEGTCIEVLKIS